LQGRHQGIAVQFVRPTLTEIELHVTAYFVTLNKTHCSYCSVGFTVVQLIDLLLNVLRGTELTQGQLNLK